MGGAVEWMACTQGRKAHETLASMGLPGNGRLLGVDHAARAGASAQRGRAGRACVYSNCRFNADPRPTARCQPSPPRRRPRRITGDEVWSRSRMGTRSTYAGAADACPTLRDRHCWSVAASQAIRPAMRPTGSWSAGRPSSSSRTSRTVSTATVACCAGLPGDVDLGHGERCARAEGWQPRVESTRPDTAMPPTAGWRWTQRSTATASGATLLYDGHVLRLHDAMSNCEPAWAQARPKWAPAYTPLTVFFLGGTLPRRVRTPQRGGGCACCRPSC